MKLWEQTFEQGVKEIRASRLERWRRHPVRYPAVMFFNQAIFPLWRRVLQWKTRLFTNDPFTTLLPSGTDILLHGMKAHDSEVRLTAFLMHTLSPGDVFVDVGAHYGYYSVLAARWVGASGQVFSFEASRKSHDLLALNTRDFSNVKAVAAAISDYNGLITFWTFAGPADEWNTTTSPLDHPGHKAIPRQVPCLTLDDAMAQVNSGG